MSEPLIPGLEVPISASEITRETSNGTKPEETPRDSIPVFACNTCGDTGEVRILFSSKKGLMPGEKPIACPDCKAGAVNIGAAGDARIASLESTMRMLKAVAVLALVFAIAAGFGILADMKSNPFQKVDLKSAGGVKSE